VQRPLNPSSPSTTGRDITSSQFAGLAITDHGELVSKHFQQYPVLHFSLKVNRVVSITKRAILISSRMFMESHTTICWSYSMQLLVIQSMQLSVI
jgi:hypothetical protein